QRPPRRRLNCSILLKNVSSAARGRWTPGPSDQPASPASPPAPPSSAEPPPSSPEPPPSSPVPPPSVEPPPSSVPPPSGAPPPSVVGAPSPLPPSVLVAPSEPASPAAAGGELSSPPQPPIPTPKRQAKAKPEAKLLNFIVSSKRKAK